MVRRLIGRPRPRFFGATGRFNSVPLELVLPMYFLFVGNNTIGTWKVPRGIANLTRVSVLRAGGVGSLGSKGGQGTGGKGGLLAIKNNIVVVAGTLMNFHVGDALGTLDSWFGGTSIVDAPVVAGSAVGVSVGDTIVDGGNAPGTSGLVVSPHVLGDGGDAAGLGIYQWYSVINNQLVSPGRGADGPPVNGIGFDYGGGGSGGPPGGFSGVRGGNGVIIIETS